MLAWNSDIIALIKIQDDFMLSLKITFPNKFGNISLNPFRTYQGLGIDNRVNHIKLKEPFQQRIFTIEKPILVDQNKIPNKIPKDMIQYSDEEVQETEAFAIQFMTRKSNKQTQYMILIHQNYIQILRSESELCVLMFEYKFEYEIKLTGFAYEDKNQVLSIYDQTNISLFQITENFRVESLLNRFNSQVDKLLTGVFFSMPHQKAHLYPKPYMFVYGSVCKGKLGAMIGTLEADGESHHEPTQAFEKKTKQMVRITKWDDAIIVLYESGVINLLKLYKHNQWEDLDVNFRFVLNNEIYIEREDEFDQQNQQPQEDLDPSIFQRKLF